MDMDEFRVVLGSAGVDVWTFIDTAIAVASVDYRDEMKGHRDRIVELLYASSAPRCRNCDGGGDAKAASSVQNQAAHALQNHNGKLCSSPSTPQSFDGEEEEEQEEEEEEDDDDDDGGGGGGDVRDRGEDRRLESPMDDEQTRVLTIKEHLEDPHQTEESLVGLLQTLADMDITFKALKETDIGRHVNRLRKHSSNDVRRLVKQLVRKWKDLVDEWVRLNTSGDHLVAPSIIADGDSPLQKLPHNGHHQVPDFAYSPNPHNGSSGSEKNNEDTEAKRKILPPREAQAPAKPVQTAPSLARVPAHKKQREQQGEEIDMERLASARKRLQQNYQEAENAKKQRTIRVMEIHDIPKPKKNNGFFAKSKGGRHW